MSDRIFSAIYAYKGRVFEINFPADDPDDAEARLEQMKLTLDPGPYGIAEVIETGEL